MAGYLPMAFRKLVYVYAESLQGKKELNLDSGKIDSTFLTLDGFEGEPGLMDSTSELGRVQEVESLRNLISDERGSEEELPHRVPAQPLARLRLSQWTSGRRSARRNLMVSVSPM